jgi:dolichyl-phosphate-mannose-protein mannosyltransferase
MATDSATRNPPLAGGKSQLVAHPSSRHKGIGDFLVRVDRGLIVLAVVFVLSIPLLTPRVAASDEIEYFSYLHSIFFDHDLNFRNEYEHFCNLDLQNCIQSRFLQTFLDDRTPTGLQINFGPIGSALLWSPFYLLAHPVALVLQRFVPGMAADGYSAPYIYAVTVASLLYGWLGLALAYRLAREFVDEKIALGATLAVLLATNAVFYLYVQPAMSHADSLFASALFVFVWYRTRESRRHGAWRAWALLGACGALMTMVREQEGLFILIPLVESAVLAYRALRERNVVSHLRTPVIGFAVMSLAWFVLFIPQFLVYMVLNGNFLPAKDVTQKFIWNGAHVGDILFSNLNGLFSWTPLTLVAVLGLLLLWRRDRILALCFIVAFAAEVYLLGSFSTWFGGAAFGMRRFVNCTVMFVIGLAVLVDALKTRVPLRVLASLGALLVVWNLFFIVQYATGMIARAHPVDFGVLAYNQVFEVPPRLAGIAWRFITARNSFYKH